MGLFGRKKAEKQIWQDAVMTVYACRGDMDVIPEKIQEAFAPLQKSFTQVEADHCQMLLKDGSTMDFHIRTDAAETEAQAIGMMNFFSQAQLENQEVRKAALMQVRLFNCIVGISFQTNGDAARTEAVGEAIFRLADLLVGFVLSPQFYLFHPDRRILISMDGKTDFETFKPMADSSYLKKDKAEETQADKDRKARSIAACRERGIACIEHLEAAVYESECRIPTQEEILRRAAAVFTACVRSEAITQGQDDDPQNMVREMTERMNKDYGVRAWLSEQERDYLDGKLDDAASHNRFGWRYECCAVLLWALSLYELGEPNEICDASKLGALIWNNDFDSLMKKAKLRSRDEILDMQDLIFRYDWACVDARIHETKVEAVNSEIVYEWHYALNWLVGAEGITDWDKVRTTT
ncbi:MAG: DUF4272 domain-containing protein [bacterium]|nr:DUF4272 domain-containing protein [bacterium]MCM1376012.1 DUF4272 domain-containing protein [Muribaculum sp.]